MNRKFYNVAEYKSAAKDMMSANAWHYVDCGADSEITRDENADSYRSFKFLPRILDHDYAPDTRTTILGSQFDMPVVLAPISPLTLIEENGELAQAQAAAEKNVAAAISTDCHYPLETVALRNENLWFQLYCYGDRTFLSDLIRRVEQAGYRALVVTVDCTILGNRERLRRNLFSMPEHIEMGNLQHLQLDPETPLVSGSIPRVRLKWDDLAWIKSVTRLPVIVKGILNPADAKKSEEIGASAVILSNHGGRQLDHAIPPIYMLEQVRSVLSPETEIYIDGGISRGTDVIKALCLGANAVLIGRSYVWGLAVSGKDGIVDVLSILEHEIKSSMIQLGANTIADLCSDLVRRP